MSYSFHDNAIEPRIILVGPTPPPWGGVSVHIQRISAHMSEAGITHWILSTTTLQEDGSVRKLTKSDIFSLLSKVRKIGAGGALVVHSSELHGLFFASFCTLFRARVTQHFHNGRALAQVLRTWWLRGIASYLLGRLDRVYAVNAAIVELLRKIRPSLKVVELHAFIPPNKAELRRASLSLDLPIGCYSVGWCGITVGERAEIYGFEFLLEVLDRLREKGWPVVGVIGSSDVFSPDLLSPAVRVKFFRLESALIFVPKSDPFVAYMKALSVFVRPTATDGDAVSIREALSLGVPVVASSVVSRPNGCETFPFGDLDACMSRVIAAFNDSRIHSEQDLFFASAGMACVGDFKFGFDELESFIKNIQAPK